MAGKKEDVGDGEVSLEGVEQQGRDRESFGSSAGDIGGADVAAASLADVLSAEDANQQISERDRAEQVGDDDDKECMDQRVSWLVIVGKRRAKACSLFITRSCRRQMALVQIELVRRHCTEVGWWRP